MRAFEISLNGNKICVAGIGDSGVLTAIVSSVTGEDVADLFLQVGGIVSPLDEHVDWENQKPLRVGDTVEIKVVDAESADEPRRRRRTHPAETLEAKKRYVREMAKEFGWQIQTRSKT